MPVDAIVPPHTRLCTCGHLLTQHMMVVEAGATKELGCAVCGDVCPRFTDAGRRLIGVLAAIRQRDDIQARCCEMAAELRKLGEAPAGGRKVADKGARGEVADLLMEYTPTQILEALRDDAADLLDDPDITGEKANYEYFASLHAGLDAMLKMMPRYPTGA